MLSRRPTPKHLPALKGWDVLWCERELFTVVVWKELSPHHLTSQRKTLHSDSAKKKIPTRKRQTKNPTTMKTPIDQEIGSTPPKKLLCELQKPPQTVPSTKRLRVQWVPLSLHIQGKSRAQNKAHPTETALRTQQRLHSPRAPVWDFHQDHEINYDTKQRQWKLRWSWHSLSLQRSPCMKHFLPKMDVISLAQNRAERNRLNHSRNNRSQET